MEAEEGGKGAGMTPPPRMISISRHWTLYSLSVSVAREKYWLEKVLPCLTMTMVLSVHDINGALTTFALPKRLGREKASVLKPLSRLIAPQSS